MSKDIPIGDPNETPRIVSVVMIHDRIVAYSTGASSRYSKIRASLKAFELIDGLAPVDYRGKFGCVCKETLEELGTESKSRLEDLGTAI
jgi:endoribonuclease Dicer